MSKEYNKRLTELTERFEIFLKKSEVKEKEEEQQQKQ